MSLSDKLKRGLAVGAVAAIGTQIFYGPTGSAFIFGQEVPGAIAVGGACMAGSIGADYVHENLPAFIPGGDMSAALVEYGAAGLVTSAAADYLGVSAGMTLEAGAIGAASLLAGRYAYSYAGGSNGILI